MSDEMEVKPYLRRIKTWKIRNMVMLYLDAREKFKKYRKVLKRGGSFETLHELCDLLYEAKEDHHLLYKRLLDPQKNRFEKANKFMPDQTELDFMNNLGLLFHKLMVARELQYSIEHYREENDTFKRNMENFQSHLVLIDMLFDHGLQILERMIAQHTDNLLLLTFLLENPDMTKRHFGRNTMQIIENFGAGKGLDDLYCSVGEYYVRCGRKDKAKRMFKHALKKNADHPAASAGLAQLN